MRLKLLLILLLMLCFNFLKAQYILNKSLVTLGDSYYMGYGGRFYLDIDTTFTRNGTLDIYYLDKRRFYDLIKEKWAKEHQAIGGKCYNKHYNQVMIFNKERCKYPYKQKATVKEKLWAKKMGKSNYIINDSISYGWYRSAAKVYDAISGKLLYQLKDEQPKFDRLYYGETHPGGVGINGEYFEGIRTKSIDGITYTPNGKYIITYGNKLPLNVYDAKTGKLFKSFYTNATGDSILGSSNDRSVGPLGYYPKNSGTIEFDYTGDKKYLIWRSPSNPNNKVEYALLFGRDIFDVEHLKFVTPNPNILSSLDNSTYFFNNYANGITINNTNYNGIQNILDTNKYYKYECKIDSLKNEEVELITVRDTNCIIVKSNKYQCLWYYKTNKQIFTSVFTKQNNDTLRSYLQNVESFLINNELCKHSFFGKDSLRDINYSKELYKNNGYYYSDSKRVAEWLINPKEFNTNYFYSSSTAPYIITQNFAEPYYKIWDISKGILIDSFKNDIYIQEWQNTVAKGYNRYTPMTVSFSPKGNIIWIHLSQWFSFLYKPNFSNYSYEDIAIKAYHISNTKKAFDLSNMLAYSADETQLLNRVDSNSVAILNLLTGKVEKTITLKGYNLQAAFYSPQKKSFIGVATKNKNKELYLYIFKDGRILDLNKPCKNLQELKPLED